MQRGGEIQTTNQNRHAPPHAGVAGLIPSATAAGLTPIGLAAPIHATELQAALDRAGLDISVVYSPPFYSVPGKYPECWSVTYWGRHLHSRLLDNTQHCYDAASARESYLAMCAEVLSRSAPLDASPGAVLAGAMR